MQAIRPDQHQFLLQNLDRDYKALGAAYRSTFGEETRAEARQALSESVSKARETVARFQGTQDPELRPLVSKLMIETELAGDVLKHPEYLRR
jgi:hypothetical protein